MFIWHFIGNIIIKIFDPMGEDTRRSGVTHFIFTTVLMLLKILGYGKFKENQARHIIFQFFLPAVC